jgi:hypothetical protein
VADARVDGSLEADEVNPTLGTQTQGNYVATVADDGQSTVTVNNSGSETAAVTLRVIDVVCTDCLSGTELAVLADADVSDTLTVGASGSVNDAAIPSGITRDAEWDTAAEINAATTDNDFSITTHTHGASTLDTDSVSADELNATGVESELEAVIEVGQLQGGLATDQVDTITDIAATLKSGTDAELITGTIATTDAVVAVNADDDLVEYGGLVWNITAATCTGDGNGGALTVNGSSQIVCSADDGGGASSHIYLTTTGAGPLNASATRYIAFQGGDAIQTSEISAAQYLPASVTPTQFKCQVSAAPDNGGGTQSYTFTLRAGGADTDWTCTISEAETTCADTSGSALSTDVEVAISITPSGTPGTPRGRCATTVP